MIRHIQHPETVIARPRARAADDQSVSTRFGKREGSPIAIRVLVDVNVPAAGGIQADVDLIKITVMRVVIKALAWDAREREMMLFTWLGNRSIHRCTESQRSRDRGRSHDLEGHRDRRRAGTADHQGMHTRRRKGHIKVVNDVRAAERLVVRAVKVPVRPAVAPLAVEEQTAACRPREPVDRGEKARCQGLGHNRVHRQDRLSQNIHHPERMIGCSAIVLNDQVVFSRNTQREWRTVGVSVSIQNDDPREHRVQRNADIVKIPVQRIVEQSFPGAGNDRIDLRLISVQIDVDNRIKDQQRGGREV